MRLVLVTICTCAALAVELLAADLDTLRDRVDEVKITQKIIEDAVAAMSNMILGYQNEVRDKVPVGSEPVSISSDIDVSKRRKWLERLDELERTILVLDNYVGGEKDTDQFLSRLPADIMDRFKGNMMETNKLVQEMKGEVKKSLAAVKPSLEAVETSAKSRNVEVAGVLYYGGVGSACALEGMECRAVESECRSGICQCREGLSYNGLSQECTEMCPAYGNTYQVVNKHIIRGYNNHTMEEATLDECKAHCQDDLHFVCRSFDYFPRWRTCFLSQFVLGDVPEENWEHNEAGQHFQRDCRI